MSIKLNRVAFQIASALLLSSNLSTGYAISFLPIDVSTDTANQNKWTFSDGTQNVTTDVTLATLPSEIINGQPIIDSEGNLVTPQAFVGNGINTASYTGFWTATLNFTTNTTNPERDYIYINLFSSDDRAELLLNGHLITATGLFSNSVSSGIPSAGQFVSTNGGVSQAQNFYGSPSNYDYGIINNADFISLVSGVNTLEVIINNTGSGINGGLTDIGPTHFSLDATVYVPEPTTTALLVSGLIGLGHSRRKINIIQTR